MKSACVYVSPPSANPSKRHGPNASNSATNAANSDLARPFAREQYIAKFRTLCEGVVSREEQDRFLAAAENLENLTDLAELNIEIDEDVLAQAPTVGEGLF